mmetsp:Transcript_109976/g.342895  ORF Transcript_109976/g.342895 Transcript_109976/m.342895 type:complete len:91 (+) Transcript_109976:707-979(+)
MAWLRLSSESLRDTDFRRLFDLPFFSFPPSLLLSPFLEELLLFREELFLREGLLLLLLPPDPDLLRLPELLLFFERLRLLESSFFLELLR